MNRQTSKELVLRFAPGIILIVLYATYVAAQGFSRVNRWVVEDAGYTHFMKVASVVIGAVSLTLLAGWLRALLASYHRAKGSMTVLALFAYTSLCFYNCKTNSALTFALLADHLRELKFLESWVIVSDQLNIADYFTLAGSYAGLWAIEWRTAAFSQKLSLSKRSMLFAFIGCLVWLGLLIWGPMTSEPLTLLGRSALGESFKLRQHGLTLPINNLPEFPYIQLGGSDKGNTAMQAGRPHIFVLMIESFNARFVAGRAADGSPLMPCFRDAIQKGVWVEPFYGNATYTIKGQEAVLTSLPPTLSGNLANHYENVRIHALPAILNEQGYETIFFQAQQSLDFARTGQFMRRCGFEVVQAMDRELTKTMDPVQFWGWGGVESRTTRSLTVFSRGCLIVIHKGRHAPIQMR